MDSDEEPALGVIIIATFTENIKPKRSRKRERNGLNLNFKKRHSHGFYSQLLLELSPAISSSVFSILFDVVIFTP